MSKKNKFIKNQIVVCVINSRASHTVGREYTVLHTYYDQITVKNNEGYEQEYFVVRFMSLSDFRNIKIEQILA